MKQTKVFEADDGTQFPTAAECKVYEEYGYLYDLLSALDSAQIRDALDRTDVKLADAFERAGGIIAAKRRESGELRRRKKSGQKP